MSARTFKLLTGTALLATLVACGGGNMSNMGQSSGNSGDQEEMMAEEKDHDHMDHDQMDMMGDLVFSGAFMKGEAPAAGMVTIHKDGEKTMLRLSEDFSTNPEAPDLYLAIGNTANPIEGKELPYPLAEDEYMTVAELKSAEGAQHYEIPADVDLSEANSVIIWCKQFNATMSYAPLQAAAQ